jgi:hypothetical protein
MKPTQLVSYFSELPIISYDFSKAETFIKSFIKSEKNFIKNMLTSEWHQCWAQVVG